MTGKGTDGGDAIANIAWFRYNDTYQEVQEKLECYRNIRRLVEDELRGVGQVLDIGNGGFFNYDTALVGHVTAVDLFLPAGPGSVANSTFRQGSALELPFADASFDCVLLQNLLHHVTGGTARESQSNLGRVMREAYRCVRPGGKAVVVESAVNALFHAFEWLVFGLVRRIKIGGHPMTFQHTPRHLVEAGLDCGFSLEEFTVIPRGRYILQFGYVWPSALTPARPVKLRLRR